jgi:hypothetical protein
LIMPFTIPMPPDDPPPDLLFLSFSIFLFSIFYYFIA